MSGLSSAPTGPVAVTGAQGLLGRNVVAALIRAGTPAVLGVGRSPRRDDIFTHEVTRGDVPVPAPVPSGLREAAGDARYAYRSLDVADAKFFARTLREFGAVAVIHAAAALRDSSWFELLDSNLRGTLGVARASAEVGARLVHVSSGSVYGAVAVPLREDGRAQPVEPYGVSKRAAEDIARVVCGAAGCSVTSARVFNLLGPGLQERHLPALLASRLADAADTNGHARLRLGPLDATRDFIDVRDAADALVLLATATRVPPLVNVASGRETPVGQILEVLRKLAGDVEVTLEPLPRRGGDVLRCVADVSVMAAMGFRSRRSLDQSLRGILLYYQTLADSG